VWEFILSLFKKREPAKIIPFPIKNNKPIIHEEHVSSANNPNYKITLKEYLKGRAKWEDLDTDIQKNIEVILDKINKVREKYGKPMKVNDGLRILAGYTGSGSKTSNHFKGAAIDIDDNDSGDFAKWCIANLSFLAQTGLFMEDFRWTNGKGMSWVHFQCIPPGSGKRVFVPSSAPALDPNFWDGKYDSSLNA